MKFKNDAQRKAVMANIGNHGMSSSSVTPGSGPVSSGPGHNLMFHKNDDIAIREKYWSMEIENGKVISVSLNDPIGWSWDGDANEFMGFLVRIAKSKAIDVDKVLQENNLSFEQLRPTALAALEKGDGLYEFSGDNRRWKFHDDIDETMMMSEELDQFVEDSEKQLSKEQINNISENVWHNYTAYGYDDFLETNEEKFKSQLKEMLESSESVEEFSNHITNWDEMQYDVTEAYILGVEDKIRDAIHKTAKELGY